MPRDVQGSPIDIGDIWSSTRVEMVSFDIGSPMAAAAGSGAGNGGGNNGGNDNNDPNDGGDGDDEDPSDDDEDGNGLPNNDFEGTPRPIWVLDVKGRALTTIYESEYDANDWKVPNHWRTFYELEIPDIYNTDEINLLPPPRSGLDAWELYLDYGNGHDGETNSDADDYGWPEGCRGEL